MWICTCGWPNEDTRGACKSCRLERNPGEDPPSAEGMQDHATQDSGDLSSAYSAQPVGESSQLKTEPTHAVHNLGPPSLDGDSRKRIEDQELLRVLLEIQQEEEKEGTIPSSPRTILQRLRGFLEYTGAILLGILIAVAALLLNFLVFNYLLHMEF